jgi:predicted RND superfamily exporter protein
VERATVLVGPALILTTVVLACGLVVTVFSDLPSLRLFGWLSAFSMVARWSRTSSSCGRPRCS